MTRVMQRFGGAPYREGGTDRLRCADCNGLFERGHCLTCGAVPAQGGGLVDDAPAKTPPAPAHKASVVATDASTRGRVT